MLIIYKIQKEIYNQLLESDSINIKKLNGIFSSPPVNLEFPYLLIVVEDIKIEKNYNELNNHILNIKIKIFDKNESNGNIIAIAEDVEKELYKLLNINIDNFSILDVNLLNTTINIFNEINSIWSCVLEFTIIIKQNE